MRAHQFILLEYDRSKTAQNFGKRILSIARRDSTIPQGFRDADVTDTDLLNMVMTTLEESDPTKNKEYSQALAKLYANGGIRFEDLGSTVAEYLTKFHKLKQKKQLPSPRNDFMRYTDIGDFYGVVDEYPDPTGKEQQDKGQSQDYYNDEDIRVIVPGDQTAACYYGQGTRWCTAGRTGNMFNHYNTQGPLFIVLPKQPAYPGEKYQLHFETAQYMDERDEPVDLKDVVSRHPSLRQALAKQAVRFGEVDLMTPEQARPYVTANIKKFEEVSTPVSETIRSLSVRDHDNDATGFDDERSRMVYAVTGRSLDQNSGLNIAYAGDMAWALVSTKTGEVRAVYTDMEGYDVHIGENFNFNAGGNLPTKDPELNKQASMLQAKLKRWMALNAASEEPGMYDDDNEEEKEFDRILNDNPDAADDYLNEIFAEYGKPA